MLFGGLRPTMLTVSLPSLRPSEGGGGGYGRKGAATTGLASSVNGLVQQKGGGQGASVSGWCMKMIWPNVKKRKRDGTSKYIASRIYIYVCVFRDQMYVSIVTILALVVVPVFSSPDAGGGGLRLTVSWSSAAILLLFLPVSHHGSGLVLHVSGEDGSQRPQAALQIRGT